ncbi:MAG: hypothetical protein IPG42_15555 [Betaproteobacteria bacterium]|nr:hypothetical protein [Betaproteobacteria bacterium]
MLGLPSVLPHARTGKLRILGVASATRSQLAIDIPTIAESGVNGFEAAFGITWWCRVARQLM